LGTRTWFLLLVTIFSVYLIGLPLDVLEVDCAQLAEISRETMKNMDFLYVKDLGYDYLDKPPLLFWLAAISMKIFGVSAWAYKLPSLFFALLAIYSMYRFTQLFYKEETARYTSLILASIQTLFIITNDVRADTNLIGTVAFTAWQLAALYKTNKVKYLIGGSIGIGLAMLAKGPIGALIPIFTFGPVIMLRREWKFVFQWSRLLVLPIILLMLAPMCLGLYKQFGAKGLTWYFYTQSFGRVTGDSTWSNNPDPLFFLHTTLWCFLPSTLFLLTGLWLKGKALWQRIAGEELFSFFGFVVTLLAISRSRYQIPHYFYPAYPFGAVVAAVGLNYIIEQKVKWLVVVQKVMIALLPMLGLVLVFYVFPQAIWIKTGFVLAALAVVYITTTKTQLLTQSVIAICLLNLILNTVFIPNLLQYQPGAAIGKWIKKENIDAGQFTLLNYWRNRSLAFEADFIPVVCSGYEQVAIRLHQKPHYLFCYESDAGHFINGYSAKIVRQYEEFPVTKLNGTFLNPRTRATATDKLVLLKIE
jgi:4-amino-4-deoxy-L-arabinose transferase-like glycosyltransferase